MKPDLENNILDNAKKCSRSYYDHVFEWSRKNEPTSLKSIYEIDDEINDIYLYIWEMLELKQNEREEQEKTTLEEIPKSEEFPQKLKDIRLDRDEM